MANPITITYSFTVNSPADFDHAQDTQSAQFQQATYFDHEGPVCVSQLPSLINPGPACGATGVQDTDISFELVNGGANIALDTLNVTVAVDGSPESAIIDGVIQTPEYTGSIVSTGTGYAVTLERALPYGSGVSVVWSVDVSDFALPPNAMDTFVCGFTTRKVDPVCALAERKIVSILGTIIQLDGRESFSPDGSPVSFSWEYCQVPIGSELESEVGVPNPPSMTDLRPDSYSAVSFIPDKLGRYVIELTVSNGGAESCCTALVEIGITRSLHGEGEVPDAGFLWGFLSNFWNLVEDRQQIEVLWAGMIQVLGAEYVKLWSNNLNKSIDTIQGTVQRRWQLYEMHTDLTQEVQRVIVGNTTSGATGNTGAIGVTPTGDDSNVFYVDLGDNDFTAIDINYGAKGRVIEINGDSATIERVYNLDTDSDDVLDTSVIVTDEAAFVDGQTNIDYRIPHLLHVPLVDLEEEGVRIGDVVVFEVRRGDTGATAELQAQIVASDRHRIGFEFTLDDLSPGDPTIDHALFRQLVQDLRIIPPSSSDSEIAAVAEAFISMVPTGINLSVQPFSTYQFTIKAKKIVHNTTKRIDDLIVSIPYLQKGTDLRANPDVIYRENTEYVLADRNIIFQPDIFSKTELSPEELWAEVIHVDNEPKIEENFGNRVGLSRTDLSDRVTRAPYLGAVRGLWYAMVNGPTIDNIRLGIQILMGLPFSEERGRVLDITHNFTKDVDNNDIGRILLEDVDEKDRLLGRRRFAFFPELIGIEDNPITGVPYTVDDIVERFVPLSKGITVTDYVKNPLWWVQTLKGEEIKKFFIFKAEIDTDTGVFDENDLIFTLDFIRRTRYWYTQVVAAVTKSVSDDCMDAFVEEMSLTPALHFYDNVGAYGGHESTVRGDDYNHLGFKLWKGDSRPFSTRTLQMLRDVVTAQNGAAVEATSATGFGDYRPRDPGDASHPTIEGDILAIQQGQAGAGAVAPGLYEITAGSSPTGPLTLGNVAPASDPLTWGLSAPDSALFDYATDLSAIVVRRALNPVVQGVNLQTSKPAAIQLVDSSGASFISDGVQIDDHLIFDSGPNSWPTKDGEYRVVNTNTLASPRDFSVPATAFPQISETQLGLVKLDGTVPALTDAIDQEFRIIRPGLMRTRVRKAKIVQSGGDMWAEVLDWDGASVPFDVFTPGMVGQQLDVAYADNPLNDGNYTIQQYDHAGRVRITTGSPQTSDTNPTAVLVIRSKYHPGFEKADELAPFEAFGAVVT